MARRKTLIDKQRKKRIQGKCQFCEETDYAVLDCHRIIPGEEGGKYIDHNTVVVCACCHRRVHDGQIVIDRKYPTTAACEVLHYWENGEEHWEPC
jgi:hypothetical protein